MNASLAGDRKIVHVESGIDWLTFTAGEHDDWQGLGRLGSRIVAECEGRGAKVALVGFQGFRGWGVSGCAYGYRNQEAYLRISGSKAGCFWREVSTCTGTATRLDVQTTVQLNASDKSYGSHWWRERQGLRYRRTGRPLRRTFSQDNQGLWIGTVGTRTSRSYIRVYDKGVEEGTHPSGMRWRFELEAKKDLSRQLWRSLIDCQEVTEWSMAMCRAAAQKSACMWPLSSVGIPAALPPLEPHREPSVEAAMKWLRTSVRPSVLRLLGAVSLEELFEALGLDKAVDLMEVMPETLT